MMNNEQDIHTHDKILKIFENLKEEVPIYLFTRTGQNDIFNQAAKQTIQAFNQLTKKIVFRQFELNHDRASEWQVERSPTIVFSPEKYNIRWLGAPLGEEGRIFLEAVMLMGMGQNQLSDASLQVLKHINTPRNIKVFVSASCPYCPQQAMNALRAALAKPDLISLEIIDIQANADLADQYSAQSVPQTYANDMLIARGAQSEELFMASLEKMEQQTVFIPESDAEEVETDLVIVGGGPAGLSAGIYASRSGLKTVVVERGVLGGQMSTTPIIENYPGLNHVGGKTLVDIMVTHALEYIQIFPGEEVFNIIPGEPILVETSRRKFITKALLLATGANHQHLGVPGEERLGGHGVSYCSTCDGPIFKGRKVIMVGGGNSAVTEALYLKNMGVDVTLVHRRDTLRAQEVLVDTLNHSGIDILYNTEVKEIRGEYEVEEVVLYNNQTHSESVMALSGVFIAIGYLPSVELAEKIGIELNDEGYIQHQKFRTNLRGIYSAGDVTGGFKQIVTAAGNGAEAALCIFEDIINPYWKKKD